MLMYVVVCGVLCGLVCCVYHMAGASRHVPRARVEWLYLCKRLINALLSPCPLTAPHVPPLMCLIGPGCGVLSVLLLEMSDHC
jgi:hypothetical protein